MPGAELLDEKELQAVKDVLENGKLYRYGYGENNNNSYAARFEKRIAGMLGVSYVSAVSSGTAAVRVALECFDLRPGDEVITTCFTFVATVEAIIETGAVPVMVDVDKTFNLSPSALEQAITEKTKAIVIVHMLGAQARMDKIMTIAEKYNLPVIEDTAQAFGAKLGTRSLGLIGNIGTFSFDFGKTLTTGEGGAVVTNDEIFYNRMHQYADHGHVHDFSLPRGKEPHYVRGFNYRIGEISSSIGLVQIEKYKQHAGTLKENKKKLKGKIAANGIFDFRVILDPENELGDTVVVICKDREKALSINKKIEASGFMSKILPEAMTWHFAAHWDHLLSKLPYYNGKDLKKLWTQTEELLERSVSIGIRYKMTEGQIEKIASCFC